MQGEKTYAAALILTDPFLTFTARDVFGLGKNIYLSQRESSRSYQDTITNEIQKLLLQMDRVCHCEVLAGNNLQRSGRNMQFSSTSTFSWFVTMFQDL